MHGSGVELWREQFGSFSASYSFERISRLKTKIKSYSFKTRLFLNATRFLLSFVRIYRDDVIFFVSYRFTVSLKRGNRTSLEFLTREDVSEIAALQVRVRRRRQGVVPLRKATHDSSVS